MGETRTAGGHSTPPERLAETGSADWKAEAQRFREVHDRSPDGMMIFCAVRDPSGAVTDFQWLYSNPSASRIVGRKSEDLRGKRLLTEMPGNKDAGLFDIYVQVVERGLSHSHEFAYVHEGLNSWFRATSIKMGDGFYVAFTDLTIRKRAEERADELAAIVRSSGHAIFSESTLGLIETWNSGAELLYGYAGDEILGKPSELLVPEECRAQRRDSVRGVLERGGVEQLQTMCLTKAGARVNVSITLSPIRHGEGQTTGLAVIARDISGQLRLQERLIVADRMASVGTLAAGVAHEINNPLATVSGNLDMVIEEIRLIGGGSPSIRLKELEEMASDARSGAERIQTIIRGLTTFSRMNEEQRSHVELRPVLELSINLAFSDQLHRAQLVRDYRPTPVVFADESRLGQVFLNLLVNAGQAIDAAKERHHEIRVATWTDSAGNAVVEVCDTGAGIAAAVVSRIFDPFYTTKPVGVGTGLGLAICRNIVNGMGGEITVTSEEGNGATFRVVLPSSSQASKERPSAEVVVVPTEHRATVLVVDDERSVGVILARVLRPHHVTVVSRAVDALALLDVGKRFDVILSDLMMPEMTGMEFFEQLTRRYPEDVARLVFITGGACTTATSTFLERVPNERLDKPFDTKTVRALVQRFAARQPPVGTA